MWKKISLFQKRMLHFLDFRDFFIIVGVLLVEKNIVLFQRKNAISWKMLLYKLGILHCLEQECTIMLHIIETCLPLNGRMYIFRDALHLLEKNPLDFARDTGRIHETIQGYYIRCTYVSICLFLNCVYLHLWSFSALWLWCIYLIAFNKNNIFHKETLKQEI